MGYRELSRMEIIEVIRRWQLGESQRAIARASGVARETVKKYLRAAEELGGGSQWAAAHRGPGRVRLVQVGRVVSAPRTWASPQADRLEPYREQITPWLQEEHLQLTRVQELLGQRRGLRGLSPLRTRARVRFADRDCRGSLHDRSENAIREDDYGCRAADRCLGLSRLKTLLDVFDGRALRHG